MGDRLRTGEPSRYVTSHPGQLSLAIPPWVGAMSTSESWGVNRHTARYTSPVSVISQRKLVSGWGLRKRRSAPPYGPLWLGKDFTLLYTTITIVCYTATNLARVRCEIGGYCSSCRSCSTGGHRITSRLDSEPDDWLSVPMSRPRPSRVANPRDGSLPSVCTFNTSSSSSLSRAVSSTQTSSTSTSTST